MKVIPFNINFLLHLQMECSFFLSVKGVTNNFLKHLNTIYFSTTNSSHSCQFYLIKSTSGKCKASSWEVTVAHSRSAAQIWNPLCLFLMSRVLLIHQIFVLKDKAVLGNVQYVFFPPRGLFCPVRAHLVHSLNLRKHNPCHSHTGLVSTFCNLVWKLSTGKVTFGTYVGCGRAI